MKLYLVSTGKYSDYTVQAICSSKEKAELIIETYKENEQAGNDFNKIEEFELDELSDFAAKGIFTYEVVMDINGNTIKPVQKYFPSTFSQRHTYFSPSSYFNNNLICRALASSEEEAIKITNEKRIAYKLEHNL